MSNIQKIFPEQFSDLISEFETQDFDKIIEDLDKWKEKFSSIARQLEASQNKQIFNYVASSAIYNFDGYSSFTDKEIILYFYFLDGCWAQWCRTKPSGIVSAGDKILNKICEMHKIDHDARAKIYNAAKGVLARILICHFSNEHSLIEIIGNNNIKFEMPSIYFSTIYSITLSNLFNHYRCAPKEWLYLLTLRDSFSSEEYWNNFHNAVSKIIEGKWEDIQTDYYNSLFHSDDFWTHYNAKAEVIFQHLPSKAKSDPEWQKKIIDAFLKKDSLADGFSKTRKETWINIINAFENWGEVAAKKLVEECIDAEELLSIHGLEQLLLSSNITNSDQVCLALFFLMRFYNKFSGMRDRPSQSDIRKADAIIDILRGTNNGEHIIWLHEKLKYLPTNHYGHDPIWSDFGPDEKAVWRKEITSYVKGLTTVCRGVVEFLLWKITKNNFRHGIYSEVELLIIGMLQNEEDSQILIKLQNHVSKLVQTRSSAILAHVRQTKKSIPIVSLPNDEITLVSANNSIYGAAIESFVQPRTWIQDAKIERLIHNNITRVENDFCREYEDSWRSDEEVHLATLLANMENSFHNVNGVFDAIAAQGIGHAPKVDFSFRQISKHEEGAYGIGSDHFATDVAFIVKVTDAGRIVSTRATFVQCKKLYASTQGDWKKTFTINRQQCDDIISQTESAFYMFLCPATIGNEIWMTPARLVRNLVDMSGGRQSLPYYPAYHASRALSHWLTYDILGLWTGDERMQVIKKANGEEHGRSPRFVVSVTIRKNPTRDEAPNRS